MKKIRVAAQFFWPDFYFPKSIFVAALRLRYVVEIVDQPERADLVFESYWPPPQMRGGATPGKRVFFSGEPHLLPVGAYHGVVSYHLFLKENHFRLPLWVLSCAFWPEIWGLGAPGPDSDFSVAELTTPRLTHPTKFACEVFGIPHHLRFKVPQDMAKFGPVDLLGRAVGRPVTSKMEVMPDYKFNLCFENTIIPGYFTEKAVQAKMAGCIPLWSGDPSYRRDFNDKALINLYEYDYDFQRVLDEVDLEEVRHTPLLARDKVPLHLLDELSLFLEGVMHAPSDSLF